MNWLILCRMLGLLGMLVGGAMVFSLPWAFPAFGETAEFEAAGFWGIVRAIVCSVSVGGFLFTLGRRAEGGILRKEALAIVGLGWVFAGVLGALPYLFSGVEREVGVGMHAADAFFESVSGFTTTGASVLTHLDDGPLTEGGASIKLIPRCVLFWRSFTHWLGGMGIIVLFVAILGHLGAGGKALMRREVPGPINESVRPRVRETAMLMWVIYMCLSVGLAVLLMVEGMSLYDALCHTFGTMATGGFSTHNASVGYFDSQLIETTIIVFMIAAGTNFSLYYMCLRNQHGAAGKGFFQRLAPLYRDPEFRVYLGILAVTMTALTISVLAEDQYTSLGQAFRFSSFQAVSIMTTTGFGTAADFTQWGEFAKGLLLLLMFVGGCAGSTGGGLKVIRFILFFKVMRLEVEQSFRPNVVRPLRVAGVALDKSMRHDVVVYFSLVLTIFVSSWMVLAAIEPGAQWQADGHTEAEKLLDCASAVATSLNNIGPGLGVLGPAENFSGFSPQGKVLLTLLMLLGRLELFAILVLFAPSFWRTQ
ncbi:MAG: potassium transporter [Planctomycetaceae bacterium]|nr:potassium transporter [Planctomycetaceae bacterium]